MSKFKIGDKVIAISKEAHKDDPGAYPKVGTIGYIKEVEGVSKLYKVQWQLGSTSCNDLWFVTEDEIELFEEKMANEEIWKMLENKMVKNGLVSKSSYFVVKPTDPPFTDSPIIKTYDCDDAHNAIALAYRSGYERAMKGRPFKIGEKKKKGGHWEPVDIEQVLKGGYKVVEDCSDWHCEYLGTYKKGEGGKLYQWVEDDK